MTRCLLGFLVAAAVALPAVAHSHKRKNLEIVHPWTPETQQKGSTAPVYMTIKNTGAAPERLLSASTVRAGKVELFAGDNVARDSKSAGEFSIAPGKVLVLHPRGPHLMLSGVKRGFHAYDDFKMTLVFEKAGAMAIDVVVEEADEDHHQ